MRVVVLAGKNLLARDELALRAGFSGFRVLQESLARATRAARETAACAVFLCIESADREAIAVCRELRSDGYEGALFLVAPLLSENETIAALDAGADDCVLVPVELGIVVARLRAVLRRSTHPAKCAGSSSLLLEHDHMPRVARIGVLKVKLTPVEARLLAALRDADGYLVPTLELQSLASPNAPLSRQSLQVHIAHLRGKLGAEGWRIQNCRAAGYLLRTARSDRALDDWPGIQTKP